MYSFQNNYPPFICGIDEAGRGTLCGSLFVSGVICYDREFLQDSGIKDSKKLTKDKRSKIASLLMQNPQTFFHIAQKKANEIDSKGLSLCLRESLNEIITALQPYSTHFIYDGNTTFGFTPPQDIQLDTLIKGDAKLLQIAAASILAKYSKDLEMQELHTRYPDYCFHQHSGYSTALHREKLKQLGPIQEHRKTFLKNLQIFQKQNHLFS